MKLEWKAPTNEPGVERQEFVYRGHLPGKSDANALYWVWDITGYDYTASLIYAPHSELGTRYSLE